MFSSCCCSCSFFIYIPYFFTLVLTLAVNLSFSTNLGFDKIKTLQLIENYIFSFFIYQKNCSFKTSLPSRMKMEKTPRYTQRERNMVLGYAAQYKDIIENKRTDAESNRKKDEVWRQIAKEFNARVYHQRSSKQLRQLYKNMKLLLKKDLCGEGKGNRTFMDLLNTISQQESVAQYISEQMSPNGYSNGAGGGGNMGNGRQKYDDDYDDSKVSFCKGFIKKYRLLKKV